MIQARRRKLIIAVVAVVAIVALLQGLYFLQNHMATISNHANVEKLIDKRITYEPDELPKQLDEVMEWIEKKNLTNGDRGHLYERASLIYEQMNEPIAYYRYLGYALYYLEESDQKPYTVNIYLDLANFYLNNYSYTRAKQMMNEASNNQPFDEIEDRQVRSYAYRMHAIIDIYDGKYDSAEMYLKKSTEILEDGKNLLYDEAYKAMNNANLAELYIKSDQIEKARKLISKYEGSTLLTQETYRDILIRDFVIPYYQAKIYLIAHDSQKLLENGKRDTLEYANQSKLAESVISEFKSICRESHHQKQLLHTLLELEEKFPTEDARQKQLLYQDINELYTNLFELQNEDYADIIDNQVKDAKNAMKNEERRNRNSNIRISVIAMSLLSFGMLVIIFVIIIQNSQYDGLTKLRTRKAFNHDVAKLKKTLNTYAVLMMDIDNFKSVNDTYGHPNGDKVLIALGKILTKQCNSHVKAYRYGGEEFVILIDKEGLSNASMIAECVRTSMEQLEWDFAKEKKITVSLGVAKGEGRDDVVSRADQHLYHSKQNGKNRITFD